jgi:CheY-like chemotaxis protein
LYRVRLTVRNKAGPDHADLVALGVVELNRIANTEGGRAHLERCAKTSTGDGFPMAASSARALGGRLWLELTASDVVALLDVPSVVEAPAQENTSGTASAATSTLVVGQTQRNLARLTFAMVDDVELQRRIFIRKLKNLCTAAAKEMAAAAAAAAAQGGDDAPLPATPPYVFKPPLEAGDTTASIDDFPRAVVEADVDVVFVDQNFGTKHLTKCGTDLVREIRARDAHIGASRLVYVVSANDSKEDLVSYLDAGADGHIPKSATRAQIAEVISEDARFHPRFHENNR